jgi:hypothetical protein
VTKSGAEFRVRRVQRNGAISLPVTVAAVSSGRASGYPRMALAGNELVFAWISGAPGGTVETAVARIQP